MPGAVAAKPRWDAGVERGLSVLRSDTRCRGLLVFGSVARGEGGADSDVDVLFLYEGAVPEDLLDHVPASFAIVFYDTARLQAMARRSPLFAAHVAREGIVVHDPGHVVRDVLAPLRTLDDATSRRQLRLTRQRLESVRARPGLDPGSVFVGAELYAIAKQAAMLASARSGRYEFNRDRAFAELARSVPELSLCIRAVRPLESAWLYVRAPGRRRLPPSHDPRLIDAVEQILRTLSDERDQHGS